MKVLITGAQFINKGAQSLLFSVIDQLKKHYGDVEIYFLPLDDSRKYEKKNYNFNIIYGGHLAHQYENNPKLRGIIKIKTLIRNVIKTPISISDVASLHEVLKTIDVMIDVSGYQLSSKWSIEINERFLRQIEEANRYGAKVILMPQSFGPFEYGEVQDYMDDRIANTLRKVGLIFAREAEGKELLENKYGLKNVVLSTDLVLQAGEVDLSNIYITPPAISYPKIKTINNVGIVPNFQLVKHGKEENVLEIYKLVITQLLNMGKNIYIFRHSEDLEICKKIYSLFEDNNNVALIEDDLECYEYSEFITQFDYVIAARYHAVVHAYRNGIPAIIFGWAVKYTELAALFDQSNYVFDVTGIANNNFSELSTAVSHMNNNYITEKDKIAKQMMEIRRNSCFNLCWNYIENT